MPVRDTAAATASHVRAGGRPSKFQPRARSHPDTGPSPAAVRCGSRATACSATRSACGSRPTPNEPHEGTREKPLRGQQAGVSTWNSPNRRAETTTMRAAEPVAQSVEQIPAKKELLQHRRDDGQGQQHDRRRNPRNASSIRSTAANWLASIEARPSQRPKRNIS